MQFEQPKQYTPHFPVLYIRRQPGPGTNVIGAFWAGDILLISETLTNYDGTYGRLYGSDAWVAIRTKGGLVHADEYIPDEQPKPVMGQAPRRAIAWVN